MHIVSPTNVLFLHSSREIRTTSQENPDSSNCIATRYFIPSPRKNEMRGEYRSFSRAWNSSPNSSEHTAEILWPCNVPSPSSNWSRVLASLSRQCGCGHEHPLPNSFEPLSERSSSLGSSPTTLRTSNHDPR